MKLACRAHAHAHAHALEKGVLVINQRPCLAPGHSGRADGGSGLLCCEMHGIAAELRWHAIPKHASFPSYRIPGGNVSSVRWKSRESDC